MNIHNGSQKETDLLPSLCCRPAEAKVTTGLTGNKNELYTVFVFPPFYWLQKNIWSSFILDLVFVPENGSGTFGTVARLTVAEQLI